MSEDWNGKSQCFSATLCARDEIERIREDEDITVSAAPMISSRSRIAAGSVSRWMGVGSKNFCSTNERMIESETWRSDQIFVAVSNRFEKHSIANERKGISNLPMAS